MGVCKWRMAAKLVLAVLVCALFALFVQVNGVEMGVKMLDLDRMQHDLDEADEGNAQNLNEIEAYGDGHVDHLEQLSRELEMEDTARAHVGAMLDHESSHFNKISAEDPRDVRMRAQKEQNVESDLLSRLDKEIAHAHKKGRKQSNKVAEKPVVAHKAAHVSKRTHQKAAAKTAAKKTKLVKVIDDAQDQENAIIRLHQEEHQQGDLVDLGEAAAHTDADASDDDDDDEDDDDDDDGNGLADSAADETPPATVDANANDDTAPGVPQGGEDTDGTDANEAPKEADETDGDETEGDETDGDETAGDETAES